MEWLSGVCFGRGSSDSQNVCGYKVFAMTVAAKMQRRTNVRWHSNTIWPFRLRVCSVSDVGLASKLILRQSPLECFLKFATWTMKRARFTCFTHRMNTYKFQDYRKSLMLRETVRVLFARHGCPMEILRRWRRNFKFRLTFLVWWILFANSNKMLHWVTRITAVADRYTTKLKALIQQLIGDVYSVYV